MATTGIWKISSRLDRVIIYTTNVEKTKNEDYGKSIYQELHNLSEYEKTDYRNEKQYYVSGINCVPETAYKEMSITKKAYNKNDDILGFHGFQSFVESEVTPEQAHEIGIKLAEELWGDRFEVIVSTHLNTNHIHNHFVINSVSFKDGLKYYDNHENYALMRQISDALCEEYNLNVLEEKSCIGSNINYENFYKGHVSKSNYHITTKEDIDMAIAQAYSYYDFLELLKKMEYEVFIRSGKISVRRAPYKKNIRIERAFGKEYSIENINERILTTHSVRIPFVESYRIKNKKFSIKKDLKKFKCKGFKALYLHYCYLLKVFPNKKNVLTASMRADIKKMEQIANEAIFLDKNSITNNEQLKLYKLNLNVELKKLQAEKEKLWYKCNKTKEENKKDNIKNKIYIISEKIKLTKEEIKYCENIEERIPKMKENLEEIKIKNEERKEKKIDGRIR